LNRSEIDAALRALPGIRRDGNDPVFAEPWHAQVFALAVQLNEQGVFAWGEWAERLGHELRRAERNGEAEGEDGYYRAWLTALEHLLDEKGVIGEAERLTREEAWQRTARATPHGQPIELDHEVK
jgi:nitrile hydratase accessory protein